MMEQMYVACSDCLTLGAQLATAQDLPQPQVLRQRISAQLEALRARARELNIPQQDANEALYAIVAFIDEQILRSDWPGRQQWMAQPLQLVYFNENTAGEGFFQRLAALEQQPERAHVLQIYYLCLAFGFQGQYAIRGGDLVAVQDRIEKQLAHRARVADAISPRAYPEANARGLGKRDAPVLALGLAILGLCVVLVIALKVMIGMQASGTAEELSKSAPKPTSALPVRADAYRG